MHKVFLGEIKAGKLELSSELEEIIEANIPTTFENRDSGYINVNLSAWDSLSLWLMNIAPITHEGIASFDNGNSAFLPVPQGSGQLTDNQIVGRDNRFNLVRLPNGNILITNFVKPKDSTVFYGIDKNTNIAVVLIKNSNGEFGQPKPIEFPEGSDLFVTTLDNDTIWLVIEEGEQREDRTTTYITETHSLLSEANSNGLDERKQSHIDRMGNIHNQDFPSWEEMATYLLSTPDGQNLPSGHSGGWDLIQKDGEAHQFPNHYSSEYGIGLGWGKEYIEALGIELVWLDYINMSKVLISMYTGFVEGGKIKNFSYLYDQTTNQIVNGEEALDLLTDGKTIALYKVSLYSEIGIENEDPKSIFGIYSTPYPHTGPLADLAISHIGSYYQLLSSPELREIIFVPGLTQGEVIKIQQAIGGGNSLIGNGIRITD